MFKGALKFKAEGSCIENYTATARSSEQLTVTEVFCALAAETEKTRKHEIFPPKMPIFGHF